MYHLNILSTEEHRNHIFPPSIENAVTQYAHRHLMYPPDNQHGPLKSSIPTDHQVPYMSHRMPTRPMKSIVACLMLKAWQGTVPLRVQSCFNV